MNLMPINHRTNLVENNQQQQQQQIIRTNYQQQQQQRRTQPIMSINSNDISSSLHSNQSFHVQNFVNIFQTYCSEIKELKDYFEMKFTKLKSMEQKINTTTTNQRQPMIINNFESGSNITKKSAIPLPISSSSTAATTTTTLSSSSSSSSRKITQNVHSKNEFMQMIERLKEEKILIRERISPNVFMLRRSTDNSIVGYQCSIDDCTYMHFLRAQVNRHYKNFHSKTCQHCNQRFKKPYELSLHLKELQMDPNHAQHSQQQQQQQLPSSPASSASSSLITSANETMENISEYETISDSNSIQPTTTSSTTTTTAETN
uniref:Uncharacterized protein n=1 Tax=Dermatophagoides pteronyssinus TaxID=6956 RepID=A0A6P6XY36_DERPT|nr:putative uncharacterized protein DDB_G0282129 [Dermatophagoides pteronyssinus]